MKEHRIRGIYYTLDILFKLYGGFVGATLVVFFYAQGFDEFETNIILSTSLITIFLSEIPTGALSDVFGRKLTMIASGVVLLSANVLFLLGKNFWVFILAQMLVGISHAFFSGSLESWVLDNTELSVERVDQIFLTKNRLVNLFVIIAGVLGGYLSKVNPRSIFLLSLASSGVYTILCFAYITNSTSATKTIEKNFSVNVVEGGRKMVQTIRYSFDFISKNYAARNIVLFNGLLSFCFSSVFIFWQPIIFGLGGENYSLLSLAWLFMQLSMLCGSLLSKTVVALFKESRFTALYATTLMIGGVVLYAAFGRSLMTIFASIIVFEMGLGIITPLKEASLNLYIPDGDKRATILSFQSMFVYLLNYSGILLMGMISSKTNPLWTWRISGGLLVVIAFVYLLKNRDFERKTSIKKL